MGKRLVLSLILSGIVGLAVAQTPSPSLRKRLDAFFASYHPRHDMSARNYRMTDCRIDDTGKTMTLTIDNNFANIDLTEEIVDDFYKKIRKALPRTYRNYQLKAYACSLPIEQLIPHTPSDDPMLPRLWGDIEYVGKPWVSNISRPSTPTHGLQNRHLVVWASHGRYYNTDKGQWKWQRPNLFGTTEDLYTQTLVVPYLIPMLENAGAIVYTPRERDWQKEELIIDNDDRVRLPYYIEVNLSKEWTTTAQPGFAQHAEPYCDGENPFLQGTARQVKTSRGKYGSEVSYQPHFKKAGRYAVYVSYQTLPNSVDDALYRVYHQGIVTEFRVNQTMGGSTWVYLGTFDFDAGYNEFNRVSVSNLSAHRGVVTTDAVRFGGGMGNIERGGTVSGLPRALEGARYFAQWAGAPYDVYGGRAGQDDYSDDINTRSHMTNWLGGGSVYMPSLQGGGVPFELSLAVHSDAGFAQDSTSLLGSLAICTTDFNNGKLNAGISRMASCILADSLLTGLCRDISHQYTSWPRRGLWDKNYSETRLPEVPAVILETLSHQNFPDMRYGQDPNFKFTFARSVYKSLLRYEAAQHGYPYVVQPLPPSGFRTELSHGNRLTLKWDATTDLQEPTATPSAYMIYMATGTGGFDNGTRVEDNTHTVELQPNKLYRLKVTAVNRGGESFPTEVLSAVFHPDAVGTILIVNGFHRLSSPAIKNDSTGIGFDFDHDFGLTYGATAGWNGKQQCFDRAGTGQEGEGALGYGGDEWAGMFLAGNDFNYTADHARAMLSAMRYNVVSCSSQAIERHRIDLSRYAMVDLLLGNECDDGHSLVPYKTFSPQMQHLLATYVTKGGRLLVSGSYVGTDMQSAAEQAFLAKVLKVRYGGVNQADSIERVTGMGTSFDIYRQINEEHYAAASADVLQPISTAFSVMQYPDRRSAAVAYRGADYRCMTLGFPLECIKKEGSKAALMRGIIDFLLQ